MAFSLVKSAKGISGTATTTPAFSSATTAGNLIVLAFNADNYNGTPNAGWTQSAEMEQQCNCGGYLWWKISTGETTLTSYTIGSATVSAWVAAEFSGNHATPYDISEGQFRTGPDHSSYTTANITPSAGQRLLVAQLGGATALSSNLGPVTAWTNSFTAIDSTGTTLGGTDDCVGMAYRVVTGDGSTAFSTGATFNDLQQNSVALIIAFKEAAGSATTLTAAAGSYTLTGSTAIDAFNMPLGAAGA